MATSALAPRRWPFAPNLGGPQVRNQQSNSITVDLLRELVDRGAARHPALRCKLEHAAFIALFRATTPQLDGSWLVGSEREPDRTYRVWLAAEPGAPFCSCQDSQRHPGDECKHSLAALMIFRALADQLGMGRHVVFDKVPELTPIAAQPVASIKRDSDEYDRIFKRFEEA